MSGLDNNAAFNNDAIQYYNTNHNAPDYNMATDYNDGKKQALSVSLVNNFVDNSRDHDNPNNPTNDHDTPGSV